MAFVLTHTVPTTHGHSLLDAGRRAVGRLRARLNMSPQQRANAHALSTPLAVITASLGGHPARPAGRRW